MLRCWMLRTRAPSWLIRNASSRSSVPVHALTLSTQPRAFLPTVDGALPDSELGIVVEMLEKGGCDPLFAKILKNQFSLMNERFAEKDKRFAEKDALVAEKDKRIAEKDTRIAENDALVAEKDMRIVMYMRDLSRLKLVYEWRGTLDWYVRVLFPSMPKTPSGSLWKDLVTKDLADKNASVIEKVFADLQPHFAVSAQVMNGIRGSFIDVYSAANGVMHQTPAIEEEKGICCGGIDMKNMATAAASVLFLQRFGIKLGIPIPPELNKVGVLNPNLDSVHGECVAGDYRIHQTSMPPRTPARTPRARGDTPSA